MSNTKQKPKQKFEVNFQLDITDQLGEMTSSQLVRLFHTIATLLPLSVTFMAQYQDEFKCLWVDTNKLKLTMGTYI